ncbi:MAG: hypothetical protein COA79_08215 [Planctomycetota bacterium]|nr:MAG: hypothetical protein COA79_08215 [Planctomycetota bacterium]
MEILFIDEEDLFIEYLNLLLLPNHIVRVFIDPEVASKYYDDHQSYEVMIVDFIMPRMSHQLIFNDAYEINSFENIIVSSGSLNNFKLRKINQHNHSLEILTDPLDLNDLNGLLESYNKKNLELTA